MRRVEKPISPPNAVENSDYLRGYRDGMRDRVVKSRTNSIDGILGALLALTLLGGVSYLGWNYATTGRVLPAGVQVTNPLRQ